MLGVRARVGDDMALMLDPACELRTFMDALYVGHACDEAGYFWYEDPYRDAAASAFGHKRLREKLKTPLLITEHVRGLEQKASFVVMGGCDMVHADPEYDMGITGCHQDRALLRGARPRRPAARLRPGAPPLHRRDPQHPFLRAGAGRPGHAERHAAGLYLRLQRPARGRGEGGCFPVPDGPGLGVSYDWDLIEKNRTAHHVFESGGECGSSTPTIISGTSSATTTPGSPSRPRAIPRGDLHADLPELPPRGLS